MVLISKIRKFGTRKFAREFVPNREPEFDHDLRIDLARHALQDVVASDSAPKWSCNPRLEDATFIRIVGAR